MSIIDALALILLGVLAAPGLIISRRPDAKQIIDKIAPYQGWIGAIIAVWGVIRLIHWLSLFGWLSLGVGPLIAWILYTLYIALSIVLGFMLGFGVIRSFVKNPQARAKMDDTLNKLAPKQGLLGLVAIIVGLIMFVVALVPSILF
jgi:hypothetical protein